MSSISYYYTPAEVEEEPFEDEHRACAAENSQGLTRQQTEHCSCQCCTQETLQHSLQHSTQGKTHTHTLRKRLMKHVRSRKKYNRHENLFIY